MSMYRGVTIKDFNELLKHEWRPVWAGREEDDEPKCVVVDLICEYRLQDGKVQFVRVPFETDDELQGIIGALNKALRRFYTETNTRFDKLASS